MCKPIDLFDAILKCRIGFFYEYNVRTIMPHINKTYVDAQVSGGGALSCMTRSTTGTGWRASNIKCNGCACRAAFGSAVDTLTSARWCK